MDTGAQREMPSHVSARRGVMHAGMLTLLVPSTIDGNVRLVSIERYRNIARLCPHRTVGESFSGHITRRGIVEELPGNGRCTYSIDDGRTRSLIETTLNESRDRVQRREFGNASP